MRMLFLTTALLGAFGLVTGCAAQASRLEIDFGTSCRLAIANQVLNREAGENLSPVEGLSGSAAQKVYEEYVKQFGKTEGEPPYMFTAGAGGDRPR